MTLQDNPDASPDMPLFTATLPAVELAPATAPRSLRAIILDSGDKSLHDEDLLTLLLSGIEPPDTARRIASRLLAAFRTASRTLATPPDRLRRIAGIGAAHAALLKTAEALATRHARASLPTTLDPVLNDYNRVLAYCRTLAGHRPIEELHVFYLDTKNRLILDERHQHGSVNHTPLYPREVCIRALDTGATAIIVFHNHPSSDPSPSRADIDMTNRLRDTLKLIGVTLHDHLIVTASDSFSFRHKGLL